ncbi:hypothetical protein [Dyella japonica]|uniref:Uncharacterized protein n=1 Tax=Dyella japonica TaxID=231455 RepID=A0ABV2JUG8_9GAMM
MSAPTSCRIPDQVAAGDTLQWTRAGGAYPPSDGWTLQYTLVGTAAVYNVTAVADGDDYAVKVPAADTKEWEPGTYRVQEYVTDGTDRFTLGSSLLTVTPDLAGATAGIDTRTHARKVLDSINGWLESRAPVAGNFEINGRKISYYPLPDLIKLQTRYQMLVTREEAAARGQVVGTRIRMVL